ncbi:MBL fold metallo-hydrolase [Desulfatibacillum aliphaticivorans]|uniref:MBL fold metallo-hydrolase n=1 Tax=Desulfatibacillum aliphaticivorans TaxID=218208 RepID=UPI00041AC7A5|nr:MBL fold metallo-hydrolase [Desulfatibacillum aliphaticivorans]
MINELIKVLDAERNPAELAETILNIILDKEPENNGLVYYGIAYTLKLRGEKLINEAIQTALREKNHNGDIVKDFIQTFGLADEFFWLSVWSQFGNLEGSPNYAEVEDENLLFFAAVVHAEWAELVRQVLDYVEKTSQINSEEPSLKNKEESSKFQISSKWGAWRSKGGKDLIVTLRGRIKERSDFAKNAINKYNNNKSKKNDNSKADASIPSKIEYTSIYILAEWIQDLLQNELDGTLHPNSLLLRNSIHEEGTYPKLGAIERVIQQLKDSRDWLFFVAGEDAHDYLENIQAIEKADKQFNAAINAKSKPNSKNIKTPNEWKFFVLRDWGSYTPLLPETIKQNQGGGGGYFLQWKDLGIVIDPGFDFIKHFYESGLHPSQITQIIVTHDHYDHVATFGPLLNLLYKTLKGSDNKVDFYLSQGVFDMYARSIVDFSYYGRIQPLTDVDEEMGRKHTIHSKGGKLDIFATLTKHGDKHGFGDGVGLVFRFPRGYPDIGITSDTGWYDSSKDSSGKVVSQSLGGVFKQLEPAVMVLHVGSLKRQELRDSGLYKTHLGARGVFSCVKEIESCKLALLSEFGEECLGYRAWFAHKVDSYFKGKRKGFRCFPSDRKTQVIGQRSGWLSIGDSNGKLLIGNHERNAPYENAEVRSENGFYSFPKSAP